MESGVHNSIDVQSSKAFGIGRPSITYVENYSIALDEDIIKPLPDISVTELNAPVFGPHRDLIMLPVSGGTDMIRFNLIDNLDVSDPGFMRSVNGDTVIIGFTRNTLEHETIYLSNLSISIEPFYSTGLYQDTGLLSGSMINTMGISYKVGEDYRSNLINEGPDIEFYPSLLFTEPEFFVHNNILQLNVFIFPSMIDHENTAFTSAIQFKHIDLGGQFLNNLSGQFENISYLNNQPYLLSSDLQIILDKMIITFNASISDTLNKYADLNRYYPIENRLALSIDRTDLVFQDILDSTGLYIPRPEDNRVADMGYNMNNIILVPHLGIISSGEIDSLRLLLPEFPFTRRLLIQDINNTMITENFYTNTQENSIQLLGEFSKDGTYNAMVEGIINDSTKTIPIKRQFKLDNVSPTFNFESTDSLGLL